MTRHTSKRALWPLALLIGLLLAGLPAFAQDEPREPRGPRLVTREVTPQPTAPPGATPTIDRLAAPPTVESPTQADEGAQLYWLHCQPCHGDVGQGLTDEWRAQYPPEDQNCWESGCHGPRPYDEAFRLPTSVPAVVADGALQRFQTLDGVYRYVSVAMPYFYPGALTEDEYLAVVAFMARGNGLWDGRPLTVDTLAAYHIRAAAESPATATPEAVGEVPTAHTPAGPTFGSIGVVELAIIGLIALGLIGGIVLWLARGR